MLRSIWKPRWKRRSPPATLEDATRRDLRALEIRARTLLREGFAGEFRTAFRGRGLEFSELRAYLAGDDLRFIDWNVTARRGAPFVKRFIEERDRTVLLALDVSASTAFGTVGHSVRTRGVEITALLAFAAARSNDRTGLLTFSDRIETLFPPRQGAHSVRRLLHVLLTQSATDLATNLVVALEALDRLAPRGSVIFLLSDFLAEGWEAALRRLAFRHDVIALVLHDPNTAALPQGGLLHLADLETGNHIMVEAGDAATQLAAHAHTRYGGGIASRIRASGADCLMLPTDQDYVRPLRMLFRARAQRR